MAKTKGKNEIPPNARCLNCHYSPTIIAHDDNPWIAYCERTNTREPQVARQHCCQYWEQAKRIKNYLKP